MRIQTVDTHTAGEPTRTLISGPHTLRSSTSVQEARDRFKEVYDDIRVALTLEPRGHEGMFCAIPVPPTNEDVSFGLFFMNAEGYDIDSCIHGTVGALTALLETHHLDRANEYVLQLPAGEIVVKVEWKNSTPDTIAVGNVPSFVLDVVDVDVPYIGDRHSAKATIVYMGNVYALVDIRSLSTELTPDQIPNLIQSGQQIMADLNTGKGYSHSPIFEGKSVSGVQFYQTIDGTASNLMVGPGGKIDRSPCGTGTCARMAMMYDRGELEVGDRFLHAGPLGTTYEGRIIDTTHQADTTMIHPEIRASAHVTGTHTFVLSDEDPLVGFANLKTDFGEYRLHKNRR